MWDSIKKITVYALVAVCFCYMVVTLAMGRGGGEQITLSFWGTNLPYQYALEEVARRYNEMQDDYEVVVKKQDAGNYRIWMGSQLAGGNASEILMTTNVYADADAQNGYVVDLAQALEEENPYGESGNAWREDFVGSYLRQLEDKNVPGRWNCIPTSTVSVRIILNKEMLRARNIPIPDADWTFSEYRRICEVFEREGMTAMEVSNAKFINYMVSWMLDIFCAQTMYDEITAIDVNGNGQAEAEEIAKAFLDESTDRLDLTADENFRTVLTFLKQWSAYWGRGFNSRDDASETFLRQQTPMFFCGSWGVAGIELTLGNENPEADQTNPYQMFDYVSLPFPRLEREVYLSEGETFSFENLKEGLPLQELGEPSDCFCIPKSAQKSGKAEGALDFLRFLTSPEMAGLMADSAYSIPVIRGVEVQDKMRDFLPPEDSESIRMRFNLLGLADGTAEEYHFKQMQMYLMDGPGSISLDTFCRNVQAKYLEVTSLLAEDNGWAW